MDNVYRELVQIQAKSRTRADLKKLFIKKNTFAEQKAMAEEALHDRRIPQKKRDLIKRSLERGDFDHESLEVDPKVQAKLERNTEQAIKEGIRSGRIPRYDPKKDKQALKWRSKQLK